MIRYNKLFALLATLGMKKTDLLDIISPPTLAKLSKGDVIKTDIIDRICLHLGCQPSDIMEVIDVQENMSENTDELYTLSYVVDAERGILATDTYARLKGDRGATLIDTDNPLLG
mgnify:CR=1 FL=1